MAERKPFEPKFDDKREFRKWVLEQFPELDVYGHGVSECYPEFADRLDEVHSGAMKVLNRIRSTYGEGDPMRRYYDPSFDSLNKAFEKKDLRGYAKSLDDFLGSIEWE